MSPSIIEKMGFEKDDRVIIVHIDEMSQFSAVVDQLESFAKSIINDSQVPVPAEDDLRTLRVARAALESLKTGKVTEL